MYNKPLDPIDNVIMHFVVMGFLLMIFIIGMFVGEIWNKITARRDNDLYERMDEENLGCLPEKRF